MPLPTPIGRQREVLYLPASGHTVVLGTAGSGKTTLAILRAAYLADPTTSHHGKTLLITFTKTLVSYLRFLQDRRLGNVVVENYHAFARGYLACRGKLPDNSICTPEEVMTFVQGAVAEVAASYTALPIFAAKSVLFVDEIRWLEQHGVQDVEEYQEADRVGRTAFRVTRGELRKVVFEVLLKYRELRAKAGKLYSWDDIATTVCDEFANDSSPRRYKHVIIDEGQDLAPQIIRSLVAAVPPDGSVTLFGDVAQQIYGHRISWRSAGLLVRSVWQFKENYRNTRPIARLALAVSKMPYFKDRADIVEPTAPTADGPSPALVKCPSTKEEMSFVLSQACAAAKTRSVAILFRKRSYESLLKGKLPPGSIRLDRKMSIWIAGPGLKYGTYHSAKGLEFDAVYLPFCSRENLPDPEEVDDFGKEEADIEDGRLLYVGITRAKAQLVITYSGEPSDLLPTDATLYDRSSI